jgi:hypothetical protein
MCPLAPRLSPEYSNKVGVTDCHYRKAITNRARNTLCHAEPVTMVRIPRGPSCSTRTRDVGDLVVGLHLAA